MVTILLLQNKIPSSNFRFQISDFKLLMFVNIELSKSFKLLESCCNFEFKNHCDFSLRQVRMSEFVKFCIDISIENHIKHIISMLYIQVATFIRYQKSSVVNLISLLFFSLLFQGKSISTHLLEWQKGRQEKFPR